MVHQRLGQGLNRKNSQKGTPSHEALSVSPQGALEISSVAGQPPSLYSNLDWWNNPTSVMKGVDLHPKDHIMQLFTEGSSKDWGFTYSKPLQRVCGQTGNKGYT